MSLIIDENHIDKRGVIPFTCLIAADAWHSLEQLELQNLDITHVTKFCEFLNRHRETVNDLTLRATHHSF